MAIIVDTTVGSRSADSYADLAVANEYLARDHSLADTWAGLTDDQKSRLLISASRSMDRYRWQGEVLTNGPEPSLGMRQALAFPRAGHEYRFGKASSGSLTSLADSSLAGQAFWPDGFFRGGSVHMVSGRNQGLIRKITGFASAAGNLTLAAFPQGNDQGDRYLLIWPLDRKIVEACLEQAAHLHQAGSSGLADMSSVGVSAASVDGLSLKFEGRGGAELCARARALLAEYRPSGPRLGRG